jgi:hypothetical protein
LERETIAIGNLNPTKISILDWVETQLSLLVSAKQANRLELCISPGFLHAMKIGNLDGWNVEVLL